MATKKLAAFLLLLTPGVALAVVASSPNYVLDRDSLNFGGGLSSSASYQMESTVGEAATGFGSGAAFNVRAGFQQMDATSTISISATGAITMTPSLVGTVAGTSTGQSTVLVTTNNSNGYNLYIEADTAPALQAGANSFADYTPGGAAPDLSFTNSASTKQFGYSPEGTHIVSRFKDDGSNCNTGALDTADSCWDGLSTSPEAIATSGAGNAPGGTNTTVKLQAVIGSATTLNAGSYAANLVFSAVMQ